MARVRHAMATAFGALAIAALAAPGTASAAPVHGGTVHTNTVHTDTVAGFTGFGTGFNGSTALSRARADARAQIARAGLDLTQAGCFESYNIVEFNDFSSVWEAQSIWQCNNA